jgi:hypothetical protein
MLSVLISSAPEFRVSLLQTIDRLLPRNLQQKAQMKPSKLETA